MAQSALSADQGAPRMSLIWVMWALLLYLSLDCHWLVPVWVDLQVDD